MKERAQLGEFYWHIETRGDPLEIIIGRDHRYEYDDNQYTLGNYFLTKDEALAAKEKIEKVLKGEL